MMKTTARTLILAICISPSVASAAKCTNQDGHRANLEYCKEQSKGFLGSTNTNALVRCLNERERLDCENKVKAEEQQAQELTRRLIGERESCYRWGAKPDEYRECMQQREWAGLDEDIKILERLCMQESKACNIKKIADDKKRAELQKLADERAHQQREQQEALRAAAEKERLADEVREASREAARKKECGTDYRKVRVGMTLERVQRCFGEFRMVGQVNRKDGALVTTYTRAGGYIYIIDGRISAWQAPR